MAAASAGDIAIFAQALQQRLGLRVDVVELTPPPDGAAPLTSPCGLIALQPFAPGGTRVLLLNKCSPLVARLADLHARGDAELALELGEAIEATGSFPNQGVDLEPAVRWNRMMNCGNALAFTCPVPLRKPSPGRAVVHGRRVLVQYERESLSEPFVERMADRWAVRDAALADELEWALARRPQPHGRLWSLLRPLEGLLLGTAAEGDAGGGGAGGREHDAAARAPGHPAEPLLTYAPMLPVLLGAERLLGATPADGGAEAGAAAGRGARGGALVEACSRLLATDRLFALSVFYSITLIDRTGTLRGPLRTAALDPLPSRELIGRHGARPLAELLEERARALWALADRGGAAEGEGAAAGPLELQVMWSGGIDSTAALCALMRVASAEQRGRLVVACDDASIKEYPYFYSRFVLGEGEGAQRALRVERLAGRSVSREAFASRRRLSVTGELGDQLFGSDLMEAAFLTSPPPDGAGGGGAAGFNAFAVEGGLDAPWQATLLPALEACGLLCGTAAEWEAWVAPQLAKAPLPIRSTFDMLWWLNFSCKWQQVSLRVAHNAPEAAALADGGVDAPAARLRVPFDRVRHFFQAAELQAWACAPHSHATKFGDRAVWRSYKEPLKAYIRACTGDEEYYAHKCKVGSLHRPTERPAVSPMQGLDAAGRVLRWGALSLLPANLDRAAVASAVGLLSDEARAVLAPVQSAVWHPATRAAHVYPWPSLSGGRSPFSAERGGSALARAAVSRFSRSGRRASERSLEGLCSALVPEELVRGRTVLELGPWLGAISHWALAHGAVAATYIHHDQETCARASQLLLAAAAAAPRAADVHCAPELEWLCGLAEGSVEVVVVADVVDAHPRALSVLHEAARVAARAVVLSGAHADATRGGELRETSLRTVRTAQRAAAVAQLQPSAPSAPLPGPGAAHAGTGATAAAGPSARAPTGAHETLSLSRELCVRALSSHGLECTSVSLAPPSSGAAARTGAERGVPSADATDGVDAAVDEYSHVARGDVLPRRFLLRAERSEPAAAVPMPTAATASTAGSAAAELLGSVPRSHAAEPCAAAASADGPAADAAHAAAPAERKAEASRSFLVWPQGVVVGAAGRLVGCAERAGTPAHALEMHTWSAARPWSGGSVGGTAFGFAFFPPPDAAAAAEPPAAGRALGSAAATAGPAGPAQLAHSNGAHTDALRPGMYFSAAGELSVRGGAGGFVIVAPQFHGLHALGGPIERRGRLPYIDGCTDTLLVPPPLLGDPCLNHLHFPPATVQTLHTHPSARAGCVARGRGTCVYDGSGRALGDADGMPQRGALARAPLLPGSVFIIPAGLLHAFETDDGCSMDVIAYHPDSDFGPTPSAHPMINRTIINGMSASLLVQQAECQQSQRQ